VGLIIKLQIVLHVVLCCVPCFRYVVLISGQKAIHDALVVKSLAFADRPDFYTQLLVNKQAKG